MAGVPVFIEVLHSQQSAPLQVCRKIMVSLFKQRVAPLPFASSVEELRDMLAGLKMKGLTPSIFIINTYWAEEILEQIDPLIGSTPVLFFVREMGGDAIIKNLNAEDGKERISGILRRMTPRLTSIWTYGSLNCEAMAQKASAAVMEFLREGSFYHVERHGPLQASLLQMINSIEGGSPPPPQPTATVKVPVNKISNIEIPAPPELSGGKRRGVHGNLSQIALSSLLMMLDMEKKSGELVVARETEAVRLLIRKGRVVCAHADCQCSSIADGAETVYFVLGWKNGDFDFSPSEIDVPDEINMQTTALLMEAARRVDEPARAN